MSKNIKCNACEKLATVHLTQIVDKQIHKIDLCEECAKEKGVADPEGFSFSDMFGDPTTPEIGPEGEPPVALVDSHTLIFANPAASDAWTATTAFAQS